MAKSYPKGIVLCVAFRKLFHVEYCMLPNYGVVTGLIVGDVAVVGVVLIVVVAYPECFSPIVQLYIWIQWCIGYSSLRGVIHLDRVVHRMHLN